MVTKGVHAGHYRDDKIGYTVNLVVLVGIPTPIAGHAYSAWAVDALLLRQD